MKNELFKGSENRLPAEDSHAKQPPHRYTWLLDLVKIILKPFRKRGMREKEIKFKRTEVTKDRYIQHEFTYKEKDSTND